MNTTLREVLARRADDAGLPDLDVDELIGLGEVRLRRRRASAVLGGAVAVVLVIAVAIGAVRGGPVKDSNSPVNNPTSSPTDTVPPPARKIVYSNGYTSTTIHFGDRVVETGNGHVHMDVTDDGFVYTAAGSVWFSDGGRPEEIGPHLGCRPGNGEFSNFDDAVISGDTGSRVAWFDCSDLVVFDTGLGREVVRTPIPSCGRGCGLDAIVGAHVYFTNDNYARRTLRHFVLDVPAGSWTGATRRSYTEDVRSHARGLLIGDSWETATPSQALARFTSTPQVEAFRAVGSRLVPYYLSAANRKSTQAFDAATGQPVRLDLPAGYEADGGSFSLFEWLDDDTVALMGGPRGDIVTCRLPDGPCEVAVRGRKGEGPRVVPGWPLPG